MQRASLACIEALAEGLEKMLAGSPPMLLNRPLKSGRWRPQESMVIWEQSAERVSARIRAASGPYGGARTSLGETVLWCDAVEVLSSETPSGWLPGTIYKIESRSEGNGIQITTGQGLIRLSTVRPGWRPSRPAAEFAGEVGASIGYQLT
jgi:methionyl-tRNA formyltransferase